MIEQAITDQSLISETLVAWRTLKIQWSSYVYRNWSDAIWNPISEQEQKKSLGRGNAMDALFLFFAKTGNSSCNWNQWEKKRREKRHQHQSYQCPYFHCCRIQDKILGPFHRIWRKRINIYLFFLVVFSTVPMLSYFTVTLFSKNIKGFSIISPSVTYVSVVLRDTHISPFTKSGNRLVKKLNTVFSPQVWPSHFYCGIIFFRRHTDTRDWRLQKHTVVFNLLYC